MFCIFKIYVLHANSAYILHKYTCILWKQNSSKVLNRKPLPFNVFHIHLCSFSEWHAYRSYFHLSTLNTICCLINHKDLVDTTHSPNHCTTREFPHVFILLDFYVCLWLIKVECGLVLARWRRGQCVYHQEFKKFIGEKGRQPSLSQQWVSTGLVVQRWRKAGAVVLEMLLWVMCK